MEIGDAVRQARVRAGLSQHQLARLLVTSKRPAGVWSTYVGQIEKGSKVPSEEICLKLAEILELPPALLLVAACRAKADLPIARRFLAELLEAVIQLGDAPPISAGAEAQGGAEWKQGTIALLDNELWLAGVHSLGRCGRLEELYQVLAELEAVPPPEWEQLRRVLRSPAVRCPRGNLHGESAV